MLIEIVMPRLSDTMEEGTVLRWVKRVGDPVTRGEVIAEVETDKADMEIEAERDGTLAEIRVPEGGSAAVGSVLAVLDEIGSTAPARSAQKSESAVGVPAAPATRAATIATPPPVPPPAAKGPVTSPPGSARSPGGPPAPAGHAGPPAPPGARANASDLSLSSDRRGAAKLRLAVAKQMTAAKHDVPHFYMTSEIDMSEAVRVRAELVEAGLPERITFTHLIIRAVTLALARHPRVNASWRDGEVEFHQDINVGIAVAVEDGLIAPVLRQCQRLSLRQIASAAAVLVEQAVAGKFSGDALVGGTFTVSNLGMLDIEEFSAVIIPPQAAILAVGAIRQRPIVRRGQLTVAETMRVTLSADHRVLTGLEAGRFLEDLKRTLEQPVRLVLESP